MDLSCKYSVMGNENAHSLPPTASQEYSSSSSEHSLGSEGLGPLPDANSTELPRAASALLPAQNSLSSSLDSLVSHSLSQSTSSQYTSSRSQSPSKLTDNKCHICSYTTNRRSNLLRHLETMHKNQDDHSLECCESMFSSKSELREHKRRSHSNGYGCHICSRSFCRRALLKRHMNVHSGQKDFTCGCCEYATSHKSNLERHIYRLHGESAGNSFKASRASFSKRRPVDQKPLPRFTGKRYHSLPTGINTTGTLDEEENVVTSSVSPSISAATGKPRLCSTLYKCPKCSLSFSSQIESSVHSLTCEIMRNSAEDIVKAAIILMQLKHSNESLFKTKSEV